MSRIKNRHALPTVQFLDVIENMTPALWVDPHGGLIHNDERWPVQEGGANVDSPLHTSRELIDPVSLSFHQPDDLQNLIYTRFECFAAQAIHLPPENEIVTGR